MNTDCELIQKALDAAPACKGLVWGKLAKSLGVRPVEPSDPRAGTFSASLQVTLNGKKHLLQVHVRHALNRIVLERVIALKTKGHPFILICGHVTSSQAEILSRHEVPFIDAAGNASLSLPGLHLFVIGKGRPARPAPAAPARSFHRAGLQVIFAFLADPNLVTNPHLALLNQPFRSVKHTTGVALGSIAAIVRGLAESQYIVEDGGLRSLVNRRLLIEKWVAAYVDRLRPKLVAHRFRSKGGEWWTAVPSLGEGHYWGGEVAAARLTGLLQPERATIYSRGDVDRLSAAAGLRPDPEGDVEVLEAFWGKQPHGSHGDCVHPLLVYADLIAGDLARNMDTVTRVYEKYLRHTVESGE
jgi:hypothetical protein